MIFGDTIATPEKMRILGVVMKNDTAPAQTLDLLTPAQIARELRTTPQTIGNWHRAGVIPAVVSVGRIIRFNLADVLEALTAAGTNRRDAR